LSRTTHTGRVLALLLVLALLAAPRAEADPIDLIAAPVHLDREDASVSKLGPLRFMGGFALDSSDQRFGGLSGIVVDGNRLTAVSDRGFWFRGLLNIGADGTFTGIEDGQLAPILSSKGEPLKIERGEHDAEALTKWGTSYAVAFERFHRIGLYDPAAGDEGRPEYVRDIPGIAKSPANGGIETLVGLGDGRLLALTEEAESQTDDILGWIIDQERRDPIGYPKTRWKPTDAAYHPQIGVLILERRFSALTGFSARIRLVDPESITPGGVISGSIAARFAGSIISDNFEGIAVSRAPDGRLLVWIVSDDNFSFFQQTLLLAFLWDPD